MIRTRAKLWLVLPLAVVLALLLFAAIPPPAVAATAEIKYSPLFEASLQNTIREFAEKESGEYFQRVNDATTERAATADTGDTRAGASLKVAIPGVPSIPSTPYIPPSVPSYTSSYSCGATCGSTCGATCNTTCGSTCTSTCTYSCSYTCGSTCGSTCAGSSSCAGSSTCMGSSSCQGSSTCVGSNTCVGGSSCAGSSTCFGTNTCSGNSTCMGTSTCSFGSSGCINYPTTPTPTPGPSPSPPSTSDPLPETPQPAPVNDGSKPSSWAQAQVEEAIGYDLVPYELQNNYQSNITRREFCRLLIYFLDEVASLDPDYDGILNESLTESPFTDVDDDDVTWAYHLDIVSGVGEGRFNPEGYITRQEAATMLCNLADNVLYMDISAPAAGFSDSGQIAHWAQGPVNFVCQRGIMGGVGNNTFACQSYYTREQAIVTVMRLIDAFLDD